MCAGPVFSLVFLSQSCSVFLSCDISTVTVLIRGSRELRCCFVGNLCLHSKRTCFRPSSCVALSLDSHTWKRSGVGRGGASFWFVVFEWCKFRPLVRDHKVAQKRPCQQLVVTNSNTQRVRFRDCWEDRSASQDVKMNGTIGVSSSVQ